MKQTETGFKGKRKYTTIMILCFLYGGFSLASFALQSYTVFWQTEIMGFPFGENRALRIESGVDDLNRFPQFAAAPDLNHPVQDEANRIARARTASQNMLGMLVSPVSLSWLIGAMVSILAGMAIWNITREKERKSIRQETADNLLLPDEKKIIDALKKSKYEMKQSSLAKETGLSKVQVHRAVKRLESRGILEKHAYGLTNKIILNKKLFE
jgi:uncharacterized membrane protein